VQGGDLRKALTSEGSDRVTWWNKGKQIACDVARGLAFLHSNKVIHREQWPSWKSSLESLYHAQLTFPCQCIKSQCANEHHPRSC